MFKKRAFTLIELLVVIAIIAMLMAILMPALQAGKEQGARAACLSNLKQLTLAWIMYADNNDDKICGSDIGKPLSTPRSTWWIDWPSGVPTPPEVWPAGFSYVELTRPQGYPVVQLIEHAEKALKDGRLWSYINDYKLYKCPTSRKGDYQSYAIVDSMNGWCKWPTSDVTFKKRITTKLQLRRASDRMVFICECPPDFGTGDGSWGIYYDQALFHDPPPINHGRGGTFSFADGHAEYWKWKDRRTTDPTERAKSQTDNEDLQRLQRAIWGDLGYIPTNN